MATTTGASSNSSSCKFEKSHENLLVRRTCNLVASDFNRPSISGFISIVANNLRRW